MNGERLRLERAATELVAGMRRFSIRQKNIWQRVPYRALLADGRPGHSDSLTRAYRLGYWPVRSSISARVYTVYVDLVTGVLIDARRIHIDRESVPAPFEDVLRIAARVSDIDVGAVLRELAELARRPDAPDRRPWRVAVRKELRLRACSYSASQRGPLPLYIPVVT